MWCSEPDRICEQSDKQLNSASACVNIVFVILNARHSSYKHIGITLKVLFLSTHSRQSARWRHLSKHNGKRHYVPIQVLRKYTHKNMYVHSYVSELQNLLNFSIYDNNKIVFLCLLRRRSPEGAQHQNNKRDTYKHMFMHTDISMSMGLSRWGPEL